MLARSSRADESSSESYQRRSYSSSRIEEKPSTSSNQSVEFTEFVSTSVVPKSSLVTEIDTKKRSRSFVRPLLRSVVPDSQLITLARRPALPGRGKIVIEKKMIYFHLNLINCYSWSTT